MKTVYVNILFTFWSGLLIFMFFVAMQSAKQMDNITSAEGYGTGGLPTDNSNLIQYEGDRIAGLKTNQTEEIPIGMPVEKEEFDRMKDEAKD